MKKILGLCFAGLLLVILAGGLAFPQGAITLVQIISGGLVVSSSNPLPVTGAGGGGSLSVTGNVGGFDTNISNTPTVQNAAYSSGNAIGGLQTIAFLRTAGGSGILNNVSVWSKGGSTTAITDYIFNANPTSSTCTDRSAFVLAAADVSKLIIAIPPVLTPAVVGAGTTDTTASQQSPISVKNGDSTVNLYVCPVVGGTVTPATTTDLVFGYAGVQD
jgi:hypothetical protein